MEILVIEDCKFALDGGLNVKEFCEGEIYDLPSADSYRMVELGLSVIPVGDDEILAIEVEVPSAPTVKESHKTSKEKKYAVKKDD